MAARLLIKLMHPKRLSLGMKRGGAVLCKIGGVAQLMLAEGEAAVAATRLRTGDRTKWPAGHTGVLPSRLELGPTRRPCPSHPKDSRRIDGTQCLPRYRLATRQLFESPTQTSTGMTVS